MPVNSNCEIDYDIFDAKVAWQFFCYHDKYIINPIFCKTWQLLALVTSLICISPNS